MTEPNMIERVARAINKAMSGDAGDWTYLRDEARAAIGAMREPTDEMMMAAFHAVELHVPASPQTDNMGVRKQTWQAMIDEALKR